MAASTGLACKGKWKGSEPAAVVVVGHNTGNCAAGNPLAPQNGALKFGVEDRASMIKGASAQDVQQSRWLGLVVEVPVNVRNVFLPVEDSEPGAG